MRRAAAWLRGQWGYGPAFAWHAALAQMLALDEVRQAQHEGDRLTPYDRRDDEGSVIDI